MNKNLKDNENISKGIIEPFFVCGGKNSVTFMLIVIARIISFMKLSKVM